MPNPSLVGGDQEIKVVASNEVTVALRQRNRQRFPIITKYDQDKDIFLFLEPNPFFPEQNIAKYPRRLEENTRDQDGLICSRFAGVGLLLSGRPLR